MKHTRKRSRFCSTKCGNSRTFTELWKSKVREKILQWKETDEGEKNSYLINKNQQQVISIPYPEEVLDRDQFIADKILWGQVDKNMDWEKYFGWKGGWVVNTDDD